MKNSLNDTIVAPGTLPGESAIGIIRISGKDSIKIADRIFRSKNNKTVQSMQSYTISYGSIQDRKGEMVDQVILSIMRSPKSYTREDVVEINCHGGMLATKKVMELVIENGARIAEPGEFTKRAYLNGRIDLSQAEAVVEIIRAKTEQSLKIAAKNLKGETGEKIKNLKKALLDVLVDLEASIDFIEEDLEISPYEKLKDKTKNISGEIEKLIEDEKRGELVKNGIKVSIVGKPNVGKSSLLNALAKKEKAIVTHIPGTTRDAIEEIIYVEGIPLILTDTAGIRNAKNVIEKIGVKKSLEHIEESDVIIAMIDCSRQLDKDDENLFEKITDKEIIICINKIDLENVVDIKKVKNIRPDSSIVKISAKKEEGIEDLEKKIKELGLADSGFNIYDRIIINTRQKNILEEVHKLLSYAIKAMNLKMSEEFPVSDLKIAYELLGEITGENTNEDIINGIFAKFCIGK